ncbi:unnamed protein product [Pleuronectes platessa]|uniref:Uncharacterized protein n=1 Tax=Pleuronectes platessa TaxID=8262 RepID=A0A9N7UUE0_PLEPL|nr:unnamed protein product [Pleuronectes platessa]
MLRLIITGGRKAPPPCRPPGAQRRPRPIGGGKSSLQRLRTEEGGQRTEDRGQGGTGAERTRLCSQWVRGQRREDRGGRTEDRGQGTGREDRGQRTEDRGGRTEDRAGGENQGRW